MNRTAPDAAADAADLRARGLALCRPDPGTKKPTYEGWPTRSLEPHEFAAGDLIGVIGGPLSDCNRPGHALVIIDLDQPDALADADGYLPETGLEDGREGKRRDHRYYLVPTATIPPWACSEAAQGSAAAKAQKGHPGPWKKGFNRVGPKAVRVIDFLGTGGQAVCPGGSGVREWEGGAPGEPAVVPFMELWNAVCELAAACGCALPSADGYQANGHHANGTRAPGRPDVFTRAAAYLDSCPPAVSGQRGHDQTFYAARAVVYGFDLGVEAGLAMLQRHYNQRCRPPWSDRDLRHKCEDANARPFRKPRGWLLGEAEPRWDARDFSQAGDAGHSSNGDGEGPKDDGPKATAYRFTPMTSAAFAEADFRPRWLVRRLLVADQPGVMGAARKTLKTTLAVELALSLGTATPFLGEFDVYQRLRTAIVSGESSRHVLQETARRQCAAKGVGLADADVLWDFRLPQLSSPLEMLELSDGIRAHGVKVVIIDPLYLCLLGAGDGRRFDPSNLFDMGPLLLSVANATLAAGATPILVHHAKKPRSAPKERDGEPMDLDDLAFSGIAEFARQWLLLSRRERFKPGEPHKLLLSVGGSEGQSGLWAVDVDEGTLREDFGGRKWEVTVRSMGEDLAQQQEAAEQARSERERRQVRDDGDRVLSVLDRLAPDGGPAGYTKVRDLAHLNGPRMTRAVEDLVASNVIKHVPFRAVSGKGGTTTQTVRGLQRVKAGEDRRDWRDEESFSPASPTSPGNETSTGGTAGTGGTASSPIGEAVPPVRPVPRGRKAKAPKAPKADRQKAKGKAKKPAGRKAKGESPG